MRSILKIALFLWQLPQNLLGLATLGLCLAANQRLRFDNGVFYVDYLFSSAVCLGDFIIVETNQGSRDVCAHERGHQIQSKILGPLYLLIVGAPSAFFNLLSRKSLRLARRYYQRFPESWADRLGGVNRS